AAAVEGDGEQRLHLGDGDVSGRAGALVGHATRFRPACFALYSALSASRTSAFGESAASEGKQATPMLIVVRSSRSPQRNTRSSMALRRRSAVWKASSRPVWGRIAMNSSPP